VAGEAGVKDLLRLHLGEGEDGCLAASSFDVSLAGTVAAFASCLFGRQVARGYRLIVRIPEEIRPDVGMAGFADGAAYVSSFRFGLSGKSERKEKKGGYG
jgi:hypothetical protein